MQRPQMIAAALQAFALIMAIIGISVCAKTATSVTISAQGLSFKQSTYGNTQLTLGFPPGVPPLPNPVYKFKGACPAEPKCPTFDPNDPSLCLPSQSWSMVIVNQLFASFAIILQAATPIGLFLGKGSRKLYQGLSVCALIFLAVCAVTLLQVPLLESNSIMHARHSLTSVLRSVWKVAVSSHASEIVIIQAFEEPNPSFQCHLKNPLRLSLQVGSFSLHL
jgi:hypothetical protein